MIELRRETGGRVADQGQMVVSRISGCDHLPLVTTWERFAVGVTHPGCAHTPRPG
jgi:hypothetical protein